MDEILASIRRIIADDQEASGGAAPVAAPDEDEVLDLAELGPVEEASARPSSLVAEVPDVAFREVEPQAVSEPGPAAGLQPVAAPPPVRPPIDDRHEPAHAAFGAGEAASAAMPAAAEVPAFVEPTPPPAARAEPPRVEPPRAEATRPEPARGGSAPASPAEGLISDDATASINRAFGMLSHTILTQNARTLEDLVKEMLKPMLRDWLDDNLPPLVERLVRTEIERVARGSR